MELTSYKEDVIMNEGRRESDHRFSKIEDAIKELKTDMKEIGKDLVNVKIKINNGMSTSIKSTENKVDYIDKANKEDHDELKYAIRDLSKKFDKILYIFGFSALGIIASEVIKGLI